MTVSSAPPLQKRCQIFTAVGNFSELTAENAASASLKCAFYLVDQQMIFPQSWGMQGAEPTLQFDNSGRMIFRMSNGPKMEIYRFDANADKPLKLMVNSSISVSKFFATPRGGLYYVSQLTSGGSDFRYVSPSGAVQLISQGSWGPLLFLPIKGDPNDTVLYIGPQSSSENETNPQRHLLKFNPDAAEADDDNRLAKQVSMVAAGGSQVIHWQPQNMNFQLPWDSWVTACKQTHVDGLQNLGYQAKIIQEENGDFLFMNDSSGWSDFRYATAGKIVCNLYQDQTGWGYSFDEAQCSAGKSVSGFQASCVAQSTNENDINAISAAINIANTRYEQNKTPIVRLKANRALEPIPFPSEFKISKIWKIGSDFFYSHTKNGVFALRRWVNGTSTEVTGDKKIKSNFEIYSLAKSGDNELIFSGLDFGTIEFGVGYIKTDTFSAEMDQDFKVKVSDVIPLD